MCVIIPCLHHKLLLYKISYLLIACCYINHKLLQAQASLAESSRKLDLLRLSLELRRQELPPDSGTAAQLKRELASVQSASPVPVTYTSLQPFRGPLEGKATVPASVSRCAAVTGQLEVCRGEYYQVNITLFLCIICRNVFR